MATKTSSILHAPEKEKEIKDIIREALSDTSLQQFKDGFVFFDVIADAGEKRGLAEGTIARYLKEMEREGEVKSEPHTFYDDAGRTYFSRKYRLPEKK